MLRIIGWRIAVSIPLLFVVSAIIFILQGFLPGDAAVQLSGFDVTPEQLEQLREKLGLNEPIWVQYGNWLQNLLFHGSLGNSLITNESVITQLSGRLAVTLSLAGGATIVAAIVGVILGVASSRGGPLVGGVVDVLSIFGKAVPGFWLALILIRIFAVDLGLFPATGYIPFEQDPLGWFDSLVLPVIAVAMIGITSIAKQTREAMSDALQRDFVRSLRANGVPELTVVFKHALRSAAIPVLTIISLIFIGALGGSVFVEKVFALPGLGSLAVSATGSKDTPVLLGVGLCFTLFIIVVNFITDMLYAWINPKVRA